MATGDVLNPTRPRFETNERLDVVDAEALSVTARKHLDAFARTLAASAPANAGAATGLIFTGFSLSANPTGPSDGKVRVNTELGVALDADGRFLIKPTGTSFDVTVPAGTHQLYAYFTEDETNTTTRRFIASTSPYTESSRSIATTFAGTVGFYTRAGGIGSTVASDSVAGTTRALVLIGVVSNAAGVVTIDLAGTTNRMSTVRNNLTGPANSTSNGSMRTLHDMIVETLYLLSQAAWKGSTKLTPSAANNYGAYNIPAGGVDKAYRGTYHTITIGSGAGGLHGDFDVSEYANGSACLQAAINALPATGGRIIFKAGLQLTMAADVSIPADKDVIIEGQGADYSAASLIMGTHSFECPGGAYTKRRFVMRNLCITWTPSADPGVALDDLTIFKMDGCRLTNTAASATTAVGFLGHNAGAGVTQLTAGIEIDDLNATVVPTAHDDTHNALASFAVPVANFTMRDSYMELNSFAVTMVRFADARDNCKFSGVDFRYTTNNGAAPSNLTYFIVMAGTVSTSVIGRSLERCTFQGALTPSGNLACMSGINVVDLRRLALRGCEFLGLRTSLVMVDNTIDVHDIKVVDCTIDTAGITNALSQVWSPTGNTDRVHVDGTTFISANVLIGNGSQFTRGWKVHGCDFVDSEVLSVAGSLLDSVFSECFFFRTSTSAPEYLPLHTQSGTSVLRNITISKCRFRGFSFTTGDRVLCIELRATQLFQVRVKECEFYDLQNVAYDSTAGTTEGFSVVQFRGNDMDSCGVEGCSGGTIASGQSQGAGGVMYVVWFLRIMQTSTSSTCRGFVVSDNNFGHATSTLNFLHYTTAGVLHSLTLADNVSFRTVKSTTSGIVSHVHVELGVSGSPVHGIVRLNGNSFWTVNTTGATQSEHDVLVEPLNNSGTCTLMSLGITACNFAMDATGWTTNHGIGVVTGLTVRNYTMHGCTASVAGSDALTFFTNFTGTVTRSAPAAPGVGLEWSQNNRIFQA